MDARMAMWVHGVSALPERILGDAFTDGPLIQVDRIPYTDYVGLRQGMGAKFRGKDGHDNWFHFSIPTPVLVPVFNPATQHYDQPGGQRVRLAQVFVLHQTESDQTGSGPVFSKAWITEVNIWDGAQTRYIGKLPLPPDVPVTVPTSPDGQPLDVRSFDNGQHHLGIDGGFNTWLVLPDDGSQVPIAPSVQWGVCISVHIHFGQASNITFAAAGADFLLNVA